MKCCYLCIAQLAAVWPLEGYLFYLPFATEVDSMETVTAFLDFKPLRELHIYYLLNINESF